MTGKQKGTSSSELTPTLLACNHSHHSRTMKRQKNHVQTKIPQTPEGGLSDTEITNVPEKELKVKDINMLMELQKIFKS